jgi:arylsulfatase
MLNRTIFLWAGTLAMLVMGVRGQDPLPSSRASKAAVGVARPHIILVMADDQGWGDTSYNGHSTLKTPHLDAMAKAGVVFNRFYAGAPVCSPTRASVMTGRNPNRVNVLDHGHYLRAQESTLARALKQAGYATGFFGKWHIGSAQKKSPVCPGALGFDEWLMGLNFFDQDPCLSQGGTYRQFKGQGSVIVMDHALDFIRRQVKGERPIFAVVWFPAPHAPHKEFAVEAKRYKGSKWKGYWDEIALVDEQVGRLRQTLRELELHENTLLWYCSDNGGLDASTSGGRERKGSIYEGGLRVPALLEWPGVYKPAHIAIPASTNDIYPTILAIAGAKVDKQCPLDGIDLQPIMAGEQKQRPGIGFWRGLAPGQGTHSDRIIQKLMSAQQEGEPTPLPGRLRKNIDDWPKWNRSVYPGHAAWLQWPYKLHRIQKRGKRRKALGKVTERWELYDLDKDPDEMTNLAEADPKRVATMREALHAWQNAVYDSLEGKDYDRLGIKR